MIIYIFILLSCGSDKNHANNITHTDTHKNKVPDLNVIIWLLMISMCEWNKNFTNGQYNMGGLIMYF